MAEAANHKVEVFKVWMLFGGFEIHKVEEICKATSRVQDSEKHDSFETITRRYHDCPERE